MRCAVCQSRNLLVGVMLAVASGSLGADEVRVTPRTPVQDAELRDWLQNMVGHHRYTVDEVTAATGLTTADVTAALQRWGIGQQPLAAPAGRLLVLPYPGGRHPRIGFLEGAVDPQRETKVSVFTPWHDPEAPRADYVVVDVPEAIWSNLGLTYLAHTHVPTLWTEQGIELEQLEWLHGPAGTLEVERRLPNGIVFASRVSPRSDHVRMTLTLTNGTPETLTDLRVQNCVMLKEAAGFSQQTNDNKHHRPPYIACRDESGTRWIITAWTPLHRVWGNARCPCLHSDPKFPDCLPRETVTVEGWLSFYGGAGIEGELDRIHESRWWASTIAPR